jgi:CRP-like cAMP-binding protein
MTLNITKNFSASTISETSDFSYGTIKKILKIPVNAPRRKTQNEILANLSSALYSEIEPFMEKVSFARGETIFEACGEIKYVYFPDNLVASRLVLMEDGSMVEVGMFGHEGMLGVRALIGSDKTYCLTVAETTGSAARIETKILKQFFRNSIEMQKAILQFYEKFLIQVSQRAACRSRHTISKQLCTWLLQFQEKISASELSLTQETIANRLGARRSSITIAINELQAKKILFTGRGSIEILDRQALLQEACECYTIMQCEQAVSTPHKYFH